MGKAEWPQQYMAEWIDRSALYEIARWYHEDTEAYDRAVCHGGFGPDGGAMPLNGFERGLINANAKDLMKHAMRRGLEAGFTPEEVRKAIGNYR